MVRRGQPGRATGQARQLNGSATPCGRTQAVGRGCDEGMAWSGTQPTDQSPPRQRSTLLAHICRKGTSGQDNLTVRQHHQLQWVASTDSRLWRAYLRKERLRYAANLTG